MGRKIRSVEVLDAEKRRIPTKHYVYVILVTWSDGSSLTVFRRYSRFFDLQTKLLDLFPIEGGTIDPEKRLIPFLPGKIFFGRSAIKDVAMKRMKDINEYCKSVIQLPSYISGCEEVLEFFEVEPEDLDPPKKEENQEGKKMAKKEAKAGQISRPKRLARYVAVATYTPKASGEVTLTPGMVVEVSEKSDSGWWFVNGEDEQGWAPSTYLEAEDGGGCEYSSGVMEVAQPGQEEKFICIEAFSADNEDEMSLEKGAVVEVVQKSMDGWWRVRYQGREAYAPGTYLKKATNAHSSSSLAQQARLSGVQIISSLQDVSTLLNKDGEGKSRSSSPSVAHKTPGIKVGRHASPDPGVTGVTRRPMAGSASAVVKQRSLERGGSLIPPPRQNSIKKMTPPLEHHKTHPLYVTVEAFQDTVGDGISFEAGVTVYVKEKTPSGWWYVGLGQLEGWVPSAYLEPYTGDMDASSVYDFASFDQPDSSSTAQSDDSFDSDIVADDDDDDNDMYVCPDSDFGSDTLSSHVAISPSPSVSMAKRPLPPVPDDDEPHMTSTLSQPGIVHSNTPSPKTGRYTSRALPPPPPVPGVKVTQAPVEVLDVKPKVLKPPAVKSGLNQTSSKPGLPPPPNIGSKPGGLAKPSIDKPSKPALPDEISQNKSGGASGDLAAMLKAKFEKRTKSDSQQKEDDGESTEPPPKSDKPSFAVNKSLTPSVPTKPSELKKVSRENSPQPDVVASSSGRGFSKPLPPVKLKPSNPNPKPVNTSDKPSSTPFVALKPVNNNRVVKDNEPSNASPNSSSVNVKSNVKAMAGMFGQAGLAKPAPASKPFVAAKPKPTVASKPAVSSKPLTASKPSIASKPSLASKPSGQKPVGNLISSLNNKLKFGNSPSFNDINQNEPKTPETPGSPDYMVSDPAAPPTFPSTSVSCVALYDFVAANEGEISFNEGDDLEIVEETGDWTLVRFYDDEGWAPSNYLSKS